MYIEYRGKDDDLRGEDLEDETEEDKDMENFLNNQA